MGDPQHWDRIYGEKDPRQVSWYQAEPRASLALIDRVGVPREAAIIDIGAGAGFLIDALLQRGFTNLTALDLSARALEALLDRIGPLAIHIETVATNVLGWTVPHPFALWHDRAAFHFLTEPSDRARYVARMTEALPSGAHAIIATFDLHGPERCSGLPVQRYSPQSLASELGEDFLLLSDIRETHETPSGLQQAFQYSLFQRI
ncbi:class I SAM-dependent methyltransferase [Celeribacter neptunius]|uniref:Methyltransferase domain-containing protein n=1 Tax=Celeribacter neptunius TaxID=588602 RepID=A0A1I3JU85_9RHOB|nr:class I SAM-dependent methyltransferase [Celeribacter neptunius]SFI63744.1 Methyltransferase domain-containing protein [Celeribacter neptunius]